jgi:hypothetical protein
MYITLAKSPTAINPIIPKKDKKITDDVGNVF